FGGREIGYILRRIIAIGRVAQAQLLTVLVVPAPERGRWHSDYASLGPCYERRSKRWKGICGEAQVTLAVLSAHLNTKGRLALLAGDQ
ncbi:hypothetical protein PFISCL1PPCAC_16521, partial [Pristionchus fissidentatus]